MLFSRAVSLTIAASLVSPYLGSPSYQVPALQAAAASDELSENNVTAEEAEDSTGDSSLTSLAESAADIVPEALALAAEVGGGHMPQPQTSPPEFAPAPPPRAAPARGPGAALADAYSEHQEQHKRRQHTRHERGEKASPPQHPAAAHAAAHALLELVARAVPAAPALAALLIASFAEGQKHLAAEPALALASVNGTTGQGPLIEENQSWLQRMQASLMQLVIGVVLAVVSLPVLWFNERRAARMECVIARGRDEVRTIPADEVSEENRGRLVHVQGAHVKSAGEVKDRRFNVIVKENCVILRSYVEVFQNIERELRESRDVGGRRQVQTKYFYTPDWTSTWHDSSKFHPESKAEINVKPAGLEDLGYDVSTCGRVEYGRGFLLDEVLVNQCSGFEEVLDLGNSISLQTGVQLRKSSEHKESPWYYLRLTDPNWTGEGRNQIGDTRVKFEAVRNGPATVVALQGENDPVEAARGRFLPYRLTKRPWCGNLDPESEAYKTQLLNEGMKTRSELAADERCGFVACCCCNLVAMLCTAVQTPELHHLSLGSLDKQSTFNAIERKNMTTTARIRLVGWLMMFFGLVLFFQPLTTLITIIPFLGPILSNVGQFVVLLFSFIVTLAVSSLIVVLAYATYRPLTAFFYLIASAVLVAIPILAIRSHGA